jgi:hypothetical protein
MPGAERSEAHILNALMHVPYEKSSKKALWALRRLALRTTPPLPGLTPLVMQIAGVPLRFQGEL